jgi:phosphonate transport system substrate-binding protein
MTFYKTSTFVLGMSILFLSACGSDSADGQSGYEPESLTVQFVPSQNAETLEAKAAPLEDLLEEELDIDVEVSVSTNYTTVVEAMASGQVDVGFLPPNAYVQAHDEQEAAEVILQAQRYGVNEDGSPTEDLVDFYLSMFITSADSEIETVADLEGKTIALQDFTSSAGYVWPAAALMDEGIDPLTDINPLILQGHDAAVTAVLNGEADAAAIFQDARNVVVNDFPDVFEETKVIAFTEEIPNDTISVRPDMTDEWKERIQQAFINIGESEEGKEIIRDIYTHEGYVESEDGNFEIVREYADRVKTEE